MIRSPARVPAAPLLALCLLALLLGAYYPLRYGARWVDSDTANITRMVAGVRQEGTYQPAAARYNHGYLYQVLSFYLLEVAGVDLRALQVSLWPLLSPVLLVLAAFIFYRSLSRSPRVALLACLLLLFQGDVLFVVLRGSHEKLDWPLMLLALACLLGGLSAPLRERALYVLLFYLLLFAMSAANIFFASVFVAALLAVLLLVWLLAGLHRWQNTAGQGSPRELRRLTLLLISSLVVVFIVMAYVYPPALANVRTLETVWDRLSALLLGFKPLANPYAYISFGWVGPAAYLGVSAFTWVLIAASFLVWCRRGIRLLRQPPASWLGEQLDWLLYAGFALVVTLAVLVDLAGVLSRNMQLRVFPGFTVIAVLLLARALVALFDSFTSPRVASYTPLQEMSKIPGASQQGVEGSGAGQVQGVKQGGAASPRVGSYSPLQEMSKIPGASQQGVEGSGVRPRLRAFLFLLIALLLPYFTLAAIFKATNEPLLSSKWSFYTPAEASALRWTDAHLRDAAVWTALDGRLSAAAGLLLDDPRNRYSGFSLDPAERCVLVSELERQRSLRLELPLPDVLDWQRLYDSGGVQLYRRRPFTPYQK